MRSGTADDNAFVRELSAEVFEQFGDYGSFLPMYLTHPSVFTVVAEKARRPVGFVMLALVSSQRAMPWQEPRDADDAGDAGDAGDLDDLDDLDAADDLDQEWLDAEVLAIAVDPGQQGLGVGTALLRHVLNSAEAWHHTTDVRSVQLNVAHTNARAMAFFDKMGFVTVDPNDGSYPRGQRSIRMALRLGVVP